MPASDWSVERWQDKKELYMYLKQIINSYWSLLTNWSQTSSFFSGGKLIQGFEGRTEKQLKFNNVPAICAVSGSFEELEFHLSHLWEDHYKGGADLALGRITAEDGEPGDRTYIQVTIWL